jgi:polyisoprenoid-binding protein YceI
MEEKVKEKWVIDITHSEIGFMVRHLMISKVRGQFKQFDASIYTTGDDFMTSEIDCYIDAASVDTGNADRDVHVKAPDFFDVENHPQISFIGNSIESVDKDGSYELWGELTIKGISKRIKLDVEFGGVIKDPWGNEKAAFAINGTVNRKDFELNWNVPLDGGGLLVGEEVKIHAEIQLKRSA